MNEKIRLLSSVVRQALAIIKKDLPLLTVGVPTQSGLPQVYDILQDKEIPLADPVDVRFIFFNS